MPSRCVSSSRKQRVCHSRVFCVIPLGIAPTCSATRAPARRPRPKGDCQAHGIAWAFSAHSVQTATDEGGLPTPSAGGEAQEDEDGDVIFLTPSLEHLVDPARNLHRWGHPRSINAEVISGDGEVVVRTARPDGVSRRKA